MSSVPTGMRLGGVPGGPGHHRIDHCICPAGSGERAERGHWVPDAGRRLWGGLYIYIYIYTECATMQLSANCII